MYKKRVWILEASIIQKGSNEKIEGSFWNSRVCICTNGLGKSYLHGDARYVWRRLAPWRAHSQLRALQSGPAPLHVARGLYIGWCWASDEARRCRRRRHHCRRCRCRRLWQLLLLLLLLCRCHRRLLKLLLLLFSLGTCFTALNAEVTIGYIFWRYRLLIPFSCFTLFLHLLTKQHCRRVIPCLIATYICIVWST